MPCEGKCYDAILPNCSMYTKLDHHLLKVFHLLSDGSDHSLITVLLNKARIVVGIHRVSSVVSDFLWPHGFQHARLPCLSPTPGACSDSHPLGWWCHPTITSSVIPFSFCLQSFQAWESFPVSQFFTSGGQSIGASASASVLPMNIQDWFLLGLTGLVSSQSKGLLRVFYNSRVQKHQFFGSRLSL